MIEQFMTWLAELPAGTVYLVLWLSTFVENVFPPVPSDLAVALAGFLSHRSPIVPVTIWVVAWTGNLLGAVLLYAVARRYGRQFLGSPLGRRLLPADAIVGMEREYLRFGIVGIFLSRFLPGFRSFVAPFVGLVNLPPLPAILPMAVASGIWYAFLVWAGTRLGEEWEAIHRFLAHLNTTLGILAAIMAGLVGYWLWRRARAQGPRRRRMLRLLDRALGHRDVGEPVTGGDLAEQGAAALLHELTQGDPGFSIEERTAIADHLRERWGVVHGERRSTSVDNQVITDTTELAAIVAQRFDRDRRLSLAERLYRIAMEDGTLSRHEARLMVRAGALLGLTPEDLAEARARVSSSSDTPGWTPGRSAPPGQRPSG